MSKIMSAAALAAVNTPEDPESNRSRVDIRYLIRALLKYNASDLHLKAGRPPLYRINGKLVPAKMGDLTPEQVETILHGVIPQKLLGVLEQKRQVDLSFQIKDYGRFRCNVFFQRGSMSAAIRMIPMNPPALEDLKVPLVLKKLCQLPRGLLLITGATNSGKSTTLAGIIQYLNETSHLHILTIEDPIEFVYRDNKASITQREVGTDVPTLEEGLYAGLRQDPDVIMIGELRDAGMIQAALTAAETGHLVMATLHTNDAKSTIDRIIDVVPPEAKNQTRIQLASSLVGVVSQQLLVRADGTGRVPACEVLVKSPAIEGHILKHELNRIPETIASSNNYYGMESMNQALLRIVNTGLVTEDEALKSSSNPDDLKLKLSGVDRDNGFELVSKGSKP
jgi:twitching motility protein PilT